MTLQEQEEFDKLPPEEQAEWVESWDADYQIEFEKSNPDLGWDANA